MSSSTPLRVPLPPVDATEHTTCCEYCPVACGYKVYTWPLDKEGGTAAADNALGVDVPSQALSGRWISETMHNIVRVDGELQNVVVLPDPDATAVNLGGTHSVRGGELAQKCYSETGRTSDRLQHPMLRINGRLVRIPWDMATDLVAELAAHTIAEHGELAFGMKMYSYQYYENVFAGSKLQHPSTGSR